MKQPTVGIALATHAIEADFIPARTPSANHVING